MKPCWLAEHGATELGHAGLCPAWMHPTLGECAGSRDPCHLIPQRLLKVEFPHGVCHKTRRVGLAGEPRRDRTLGELLHDERIIVEGCRRHHHLLDVARKLKIPRKNLPAGVEEFAQELGRPITAWLDTEYGERYGV